MHDSGAHAWNGFKLDLLTWKLKISKEPFCISSSLITEMQTFIQTCPKGAVAPSAMFKLVHEGRRISTKGPLVTVSASAIMDCTMMCKRCVNCFAFDYATSTRRCRLFSQQVQLDTNQTVLEQGCLVYMKVEQTRV